ncbi:sugar ABC transporter permease [Devosia sp.]|uniref:carbohydrate ABC transporter permease n=1 Tax=Devosia sp. TaxID=1871048 RepID=UPI0032675239
MSGPVSRSKLQDSPRAGWLMALPAFLLLVTFLIVPFVLAFALSFTNQRLVSPNPTEFVGTRNFESLLGVGILTLQPDLDSTSKQVLRDATGAASYPAVRGFTRNNPDYPQYDGMREMTSLQFGDTRVVVLARDLLFLKAVGNTLLFVIFVAPLQGGLALLLALLINQKLRGINVFRAIYFMPVVVSIVVVALLWRFIYDGQNGLLNSMLGAITFGGFKPVDWLGNPATALGAIMAMSIWQAVGFHMVIWLSGLQTIPVSLYEAADIEGATGWQKFRYVTWPGLRNTAVLILIVITMQAFALFSQVNVMTRGGPLDSTQTMVLQAVSRGYEKQDIAGGSSISVVLFLMVLSISLLQRYLTREKK